MTEVALISVAVPSSIGRLISRLVIGMPADEFLRDDTIRISRSDELIEVVAVPNTCLWASASLQVMHDTRGSSERRFA